MPTKATEPQRQFIVAKVNRLIKKVDNANNATSYEEANAAFDFDKTKKDLEELFKQLEDATMYLVDHPPDDKPADSLIEEYTTLEDKRDDVIDTYKRTHQQQQIQASTGTDENSAAASHINTNQPTEDVANNNTEDENSTPDPPAATNSERTTSQLTRPPKIKIQPFDGNPMKWSMWLGLFTSTIHSQPITDAEKMAHLQTLTTGRANQAIAGYACNASMYTAALEELKRRFGRPDIIINDFVNQLQNYRPPTLHRRE